MNVASGRNPASRTGSNLCDMRGSCSSRVFEPWKVLSVEEVGLLSSQASNEFGLCSRYRFPCLFQNFLEFILAKAFVIGC